MRLIEPLPYRVRTFLLPSGERFALLIGDDGVPELFSSLYITARYRRRSVSSQQAVLNAINVLLGHVKRHGIELTERFKVGEFLGPGECESLLGSFEVKYGRATRRQAKLVALQRVKKGHLYAPKSARNATQYSRLSYAGKYLRWLGNILGSGPLSVRRGDIEAMYANICEIRPPSSNGQEKDEEDAFTEEDDSLLAELLELGSARNPFRPSVQLRNLLLIELMRLLGKRKGEVLNIRLRDIDTALGQIDIVRRPNDKNDPRLNQPRVKTRQHTVPVGPNLLRLIEMYLSVRREVPGALKSPYLLVTHKPGPTQGSPMTIAGVNKVFETIRQAEPRLSHLHPHLLRTYFSNSTARMQRKSRRVQPDGSRGPEVDRQVRNFLAGRSPESGVDSVYTKAALSESAREVSLMFQEEQVQKGKRREELKGKGSVR